MIALVSLFLNTADEPTRAEVNTMAGSVILEFGNPWGGHCRRAEPLIREAFEGHGAVRHIKIADASGKALGRSFGVKLWPTLIFLRGGHEVAQVVRHVTL